MLTLKNNFCKKGNKRIHIFITGDLAISIDLGEGWFLGVLASCNVMPDEAKVYV